jgi:hypothetical protein
VAQLAPLGVRLDYCNCVCVCVFRLYITNLTPSEIVSSRMNLDANSCVKCYGEISLLCTQSKETGFHMMIHLTLPTNISMILRLLARVQQCLLSYIVNWPHSVHFPEVKIMARRTILVGEI